MLKDIVVPILGRRGDMDALDVAVAIAASEKAHVSVLQMVYLPTAFSSDWSMMREVANGDIYETLRSDGEGHVARLTSRLVTEPVQAEVKLIESSRSKLSQSTTKNAYHADLVVVAGAIGNDTDAMTMHTYLGSLFLEAGRPVLVVPPRCKKLLPATRIVVGWQPTREAARALHDAMPLLVKANEVDVVMVESTAEATHQDESPGADVVAHLEHHGVKTNLVVLDAARHSVSAALLDHARRVGAQLLIVWGYGHSRLREAVLGGVTRELLISASIPVLYSH